MEKDHLTQIEKWFSQLNQRFDDTNQRIENRYNALLNVCTNIRKDIEILRIETKEFKDKYEARLSALELALKELERRLSH